ncbi:hypothetical protein ACFU8W_44650 [Streptomyces sp. NPDC057565]|uniref:hypothetical protein n=1 Tax=Streptomyces sp. NPDC057565 TaxID=3346169 RepID=UPI003687827A
MSTDRNGDERLSGEARRRDAIPPPGTPQDVGPANDLDDPSTPERTAERISAALRQQPVDDTAEQAAIAAFQSARKARDRTLSTRRRDDWRPRPQKHRWARGGAVALVTSSLLGGIAFASIGVVDTRQHDTPKTGTSHSTPPAHTPREQSSPSSGPSTAPTTPSRHPGTTKDVEAHCRAYERVKNRGHALGATAWQRLIRAAGGKQHVATYCAQLTGSADTATSSPTKANKTGKGHGMPSAKAKPPKGPSSRP